MIDKLIPKSLRKIRKEIATLVGLLQDYLEQAGYESFT